MRRSILLKTRCRCGESIADLLARRVSFLLVSR